MLSFPSIRPRAMRSGYFEQHDLQALLRELPQALRAPIDLAYFTAWRLASEILPLEWSAIDLDNGYIRLAPGTKKSDEAREFPFSMWPELRVQLIEAKASANEG